MLRVTRVETMGQPVVLTTTHKADGLSVFRENATPKAYGKTVSIIYSTPDGSPINFANDADLVAFEAEKFSALTPTQGSTVIIVEWGPGDETPLHRNMCLDLAVVLSGNSTLSQTTTCFQIYHLQHRRPWGYLFSPAVTLII